MKTNKNTEKIFPIVFFLILLMLGIMAYRNPGVDFRGYYGAGLLVRRGGNPYDYAQLVPILEEISGFKGNNPYFYPPWYCLAFIPFTFVPFRWAQVLWIGVNLTLFYISLEWLWNVLDWKIESWFRWVLFTFAGIMFGYGSLISENSGFVLLFGLALVLRSIKRDQYLWAGLGLIIMLTKPQAVFVAVLALSIWALREKPKVILWTFVWFASFLVLATIIFPAWWRFDIENFGVGIYHAQDGANAVVGKRVAATIYDWLTYSFGVDGFLYIFIILLIGGFGMILLFRIWRRWYDPRYIAAAAILFTFLITPYALLYDFLTFVLPFFLIVKCLPYLQRSSMIMVVALFALVIIVQLIAQLQFQAFWVVLCMTGAFWIVTRSHDISPTHNAVLKF